MREAAPTFVLRHNTFQTPRPIETLPNRTCRESTRIEIFRSSRADSAHSSFFQPFEHLLNSPIRFQLPHSLEPRAGFRFIA